MQTLVAKKAVECEATATPVAVVAESDLEEILRGVRERQKSILKKEASLLKDWQEIGLQLLEAKALIPRGQWEKTLPVQTGIEYRTIQRYIQLYENRTILPEGVTPTDALKYLNGLNRKSKAMSPASVATSVVSAEDRQKVEDLYQAPDTEVKWQKNGSAVAVERPGKTTVFPTPEAAIAAAKKAVQPDVDPKVSAKPVSDDAISISPKEDDEAIAKLKRHVEIKGEVFNPFAGDGRIKRGFPDAIAAGIEGAKNFEPDMYLNCNELASWEAVKEVHGQPDWAIAQIDGSDPVQGLEFATLYAKVGIAVLVEPGFLFNPANQQWLREKSRHQELQIVAGDRLWLVWQRDRDWNHPGFTCPFIY